MAGEDKHGLTWAGYQSVERRFWEIPSKGHDKLEDEMKDEDECR